MSDMRVNLTVRARSEGSGPVDAQTAAVDKLGKTSTATGNKAKQALRWQNGQWQEVKQSTSEAGAEVKKFGGTMDRVGTQGQRATEAIKRGLQDDARELRRSTSEAERAGRGMDRLRMLALRSTSALRTMASAARREFDALHKVLGGVGGRLATLGIGAGAVQTLRSSARLDRTNIQLRQTADMSAADVDDWRRTRWAMARANGNDPDAIDRGMGQLVAAGLNYKQAKPASNAADIASTISGADQGQLADYQVTAAAIFNEDLAKSGVSNRLLAQGLVGGRLGRAELPDLPNIFPRVGGAAQQAGLNYPQTIGYIEALSNIESQPERLATLAESGLRMFTNGKYRAQVTKTTGVNFFDKKGATRDPFTVMEDLRKRYQKLTTDSRRSDFLQAVIGEADLDTQRNFRAFLQPGRIEQARDYGKQISTVTDFDPAQLDENRKSATATAGRVKATVGEALDKAAIPVNQALASAAQYLLDDKGLSGGQLLGGAAALGVGGFYGSRLAKWGGNKALGKLTGLLGGSADTVKNIVVGRALQESAGVTPVFVTNWSGAPSGMGSAASSAAEIAAEAATGGRAAGAATGVARVAAGARGFAMMDLLPAFALGSGVAAVNDALKPIADAQDAALVADQRERDKKRLGINDAQLDRRNQIETSEMPYGRWVDSANAAPGKTSVEDYEAWVSRQIPAEQADAAQTAQAAGLIGDVARSPAARWLSPRLSDSVGTWAEATASRLDPAATGDANASTGGQMQEAARLFNDAARLLEPLLGKPLQIQVTSDTDELHAKVVDRQVRDARRG
ncbi:phage tail tape measure protein [Luteibacter sp.]|jgi:hypothetical protein|uniref:phage tail tape measure protein n=1 Tax=Luteibacter sp. TaxID=1886636 RepID=UPI002F3FB0D9